MLTKVGSGSTAHMTACMEEHAMCVKYYMCGCLHHERKLLPPPCDRI